MPSLKYAKSDLDSTITIVVNYVNVGNLRPQGIRIRKRVWISEQKRKHVGPQKHHALSIPTVGESNNTSN